MLSWKEKLKNKKKTYFKKIYSKQFLLILNAINYIFFTKMNKYKLLFRIILSLSCCSTLLSSFSKTTFRVRLSAPKNPSSLLSLFFSTRISSVSCRLDDSCTRFPHTYNDSQQHSLKKKRKKVDKKRTRLCKNQLARKSGNG